MTGEGEERGFTVIDRRGEGPSSEAEAGAETAESTRAEPQGPPRDPDRLEPGGLPSIDFTTFVLSLGTSALYHMGLVRDPATGAAVEKPNLALARQTIDTLEMLQEKTRGNLAEEESRVLESLLYELRMRFVELDR